MFILQTAQTRELRIENIPMTQQVRLSKAFITEGHPHEYSSNIFHTSNNTTSNLETPPHARRMVYDSNLLSSVMIEQTIIQDALASIATFDGTKSKFEDLMESIKIAAQISGQNTICIAFSKLTGSPLLTPNRLKT